MTTRVRSSVYKRLISLVSSTDVAFVKLYYRKSTEHFAIGFAIVFVYLYLSWIFLVFSVSCIELFGALDLQYLLTPNSIFRIAFSEEIIVIQNSMNERIFICCLRVSKKKAKSNLYFT